MNYYSEIRINKDYQGIWLPFGYKPLESQNEEKRLENYDAISNPEFSYDLSVKEEDGMIPKFDIEDIFGKEEEANKPLIPIVRNELTAEDLDNYVPNDEDIKDYCDAFQKQKDALK